jgi:hypothetical protein
MILRVFLTKTGTANISCPQCGEDKRMDVQKFVDIDKEIRLKCTCKCKHVFSVVLERRQHLRKKVNFKGEVQINSKKYPIEIIDISQFGLRIRTKRQLDISLLDRVNLEFVLDDAAGSSVRRTMIARSMKKNEIGMEFADHNHYGKLGAYLLFHFS